MPAASFAGPVEDGKAAYGRGNYAEALRLFRVAAAQGNADAQINLGVMYDKGEGVARNYAEARRWYRLSAAQGNAFAQLDLGSMYELGHGVTKDYAEAMRWYRLSAARRNAYAQLKVGLMYGLGEGVPQDYREGLKWWRLAADQGIADAQFMVGLSYETGEGVAENDAEALRWYRVAAAQGYDGAIKAINRLTNKGNPLAGTNWKGDYSNCHINNVEFWADGTARLTFRDQGTEDMDDGTWILKGTILTIGYVDPIRSNNVDRFADERLAGTYVNGNLVLAHSWKNFDGSAQSETCTFHH